MFLHQSQSYHEKIESLPVFIPSFECRTIKALSAPLYALHSLVKKLRVLFLLLEEVHSSNKEQSEKAQLEKPVACIRHGCGVCVHA